MNPNPSTPTKSGIYWIQFAGSNLTTRDGNPVDWTNHREAHLAVSRLFPPKLPGEADQRRQTSGILYRVDVLELGSEPTVLVQSLVPPELTPKDSRTTEVSQRAWSHAAGDRIAFRIAVNPVRRTTRYFDDSAKSTLTQWSNQPHHAEKVNRDSSGRRVRVGQKQTARVIPQSEVPEWVATKMSDALSDIEIVNHFRDKTGSGQHQLAVDTIDGFAVVNDPGALNQLRIQGIGRSKSYGCGLLTTTRLP